MAFSRECETCGKRIVFKRNSSGKPVPFDLLGPGVIGPCHYETCTQPPGSSIYGERAVVQSKEEAMRSRAYYMSNPAMRLAQREAAHNRKLTERWRS